MYAIDDYAGIAARLSEQAAERERQRYCTCRKPDGSSATDASGCAVHREVTAPDRINNVPLASPTESDMAAWRRSWHV
jgi:hypothetical protein